MSGSIPNFGQADCAADPTLDKIDMPLRAIYEGFLAFSARCPGLKLRTHLLHGRGQHTGRLVVCDAQPCDDVLQQLLSHSQADRQVCDDGVDVHGLSPVSALMLYAGYKRWLDRSVRISPKSGEVPA